MIIDITGIELTPSRNGKRCLGNGEHHDKYGYPLECCCNECDYYICCFDKHSRKECTTCEDLFCPHAGKLSFIDRIKKALKILCC